MDPGGGDDEVGFVDPLVDVLAEAESPVPGPRVHAAASPADVVTARLPTPRRPE